MTNDDAYIAAKQMTNANYGSFAHAISCAFLLADLDNKEKIKGAFSDLFERALNDKLAHDAFLQKGDQ